MKKSALLALCFASVLAPAFPQDEKEPPFDITSAQSDGQLRSGVISYHHGFYGQAIVYIQKAIGIKPTNTLAQVWLGRVQWKSGYEQEAVRTWERLADAGPSAALLRDWIQRIRLRAGSSRDLPHAPVYVAGSQLSGSQQGGYPFKRPTSVRTRADAGFFLVAHGSNEIIKYDVNFRVVDHIRGGLEGFDRPYDIVEAADGTLFVSEFGANRISKCSARGDRLSSFGAKGSAGGPLLGPQYLALDARGFLYVSDWGNARVNKYSPEGGFILTIGGLSKPSGIAVWENRLYVAEQGKKRISIYDLDGNFIGAVGGGLVSSPEGISVTSEGRLLVADANRMLEADVETEKWTVLAETSAFTKRLIQQAMTPNGDLIAVDFDGSSLVLYSDSVSLYTGLEVHVDRIESSRFPEVEVDVTVQSRLGKPVVGLAVNNFILTEYGRSVGQTVMRKAASDSQAVEAVLLVESSPEMKQVQADAEKAAAELYAALTPAGRLKAISAGDNPVKETEYGETRLRFIQSAFRSPASSKWRFDAGLRVAVEDLAATGGRSKKAVIFLCTGPLTGLSFSTFSLMELAAFLRNNSIAFYPVFVGSKALDADLAFLASETGGGSFAASSPGGMGEVASKIGKRAVSVYTIGFSSKSQSKFGQLYIPFEIEATVQRKSGRDECGYYGPQTP